MFLSNHLIQNKVLKPHGFYPDQATSFFLTHFPNTLPHAHPHLALAHTFLAEYIKLTEDLRSLFTKRLGGVYAFHKRMLCFGKGFTAGILE